MSKQKITIDGIIFSLSNGFGGISNYYLNLLNNLVEKDLNIELLTYDEEKTSHFKNSKLQNIVKFKKPRILERYKKLTDLNCSLLHSSYYRISKSTNIKNVITVYDFIYENFSSWPKKILHRKQKEYAIKKADALICISNYTQKILLQIYPDIPKSKTYVTHLAASEKFYPIKQEKLCTFDRTPFILFVGKRSGYKNFQFAVNSLSLLPDILLVCVGGGPFDKHELNLLNRKLKNRFTHQESINEEKLNVLYNNAVCLIYPSLCEGFGIPVVEAMQSGCPFIALNNSSIPEVAGRAGIVLQKPQEDHCATAVLRCMDFMQRSKLVKLGLHQAKIFSWSKTTDETIRIYSSLIK